MLISGAWVDNINLISGSGNFLILDVNLNCVEVGIWQKGFVDGGSPIWQLDKQTSQLSPAATFWSLCRIVWNCKLVSGRRAWVSNLAAGRANYSVELRAPRPLQKLNQLSVCQCTLLCQLANPLYIVLGGIPADKSTHWQSSN